MLTSRVLSRGLSSFGSKQRKRFNLPAYNFGSPSQTPDPSLNWKILCAAIVERNAVVLPDVESFEQNYEDMKQELDYHRCIHVPQDFFTAETGADEDDKVSDDVPADEEVLVGGSFRLAPRVTRADEEANHQSLDRALKERLYLIVRRPREDHAWRFPHLALTDDSTNMRDVALRAVASNCGDALELSPMGYGPAAHVSYVYPHPIKEEDGKVYHGAQVFYFKSEWYRGDACVAPEANVEDYRWVTKLELKDYFEPALYDFVKYVLPLEKQHYVDCTSEQLEAFKPQETATCS